MDISVVKTLDLSEAFEQIKLLEQNNTDAALNAYSDLIGQAQEAGDYIVQTDCLINTSRINKQRGAYYKALHQAGTAMQLINMQMGRMGRGSASSSGALNQAVDAFKTAQSLIAGSSQQSAIEFLNRTDERLSFVRREMITGPLGMFQSKTSTPFVVHCSLIPLHWELANRLSQSEWNPNGLAGGDFENLQHMMSNGWENRRLDDVQTKTKVELSDQDVVQGKYALKMSVASTIPGRNIEATPLWVSTPPIPVKSGQLIRIHGWAKIPNVIAGTHDGLKITDSIGGPAMAERIPVTQGWQEFTLYRGAPANSEIKVTFALTGIGEAMVDEVTILSIDLPAAAALQAKRN